MDRIAFEHIVNRTIKELPHQFQDAIKDVAIVIDDQPAPEREHGIFLGLYQGVPLTTWGREYDGKLPDKITLFKENIETVAGAEDIIPHVIRETLLHEIAHYFGFEHNKIHEMEKRWRKKR